MHRYNILVGIVLISCACLVVVEARTARCFQFTWLGPRYNNDSTFMNATCQDATRLAEGVPCREPLVASYDGTWPSVQYIWKHYREAATCELVDGDVCAQYTYYFDGRVDNSTYMCTRAVDNNGHAISSGCFEQRNGSFATRVCLCQSVPGAIPCNEAIASSTLSTAAFVTALAIALKGVDF